MTQCMSDIYCWIRKENKALKNYEILNYKKDNMRNRLKNVYIKLKQRSER